MLGGEWGRVNRRGVRKFTHGARGEETDQRRKVHRSRGSGVVDHSGKYSPGARADLGLRF